MQVRILEEGLFRHCGTGNYIAFHSGLVSEWSIWYGFQVDDMGVHKRCGKIRRDGWSNFTSCKLELWSYAAKLTEYLQRLHLLSWNSENLFTSTRWRTTAEFCMVINCQQDRVFDFTFLTVAAKRSAIVKQTANQTWLIRNLDLIKDPMQMSIAIKRVRQICMWTKKLMGGCNSVRSVVGGTLHTADSNAIFLSYFHWSPNSYEWGSSGGSDGTYLFSNKRDLMWFGLDGLFERRHVHHSSNLWFWPLALNFAGL